MRDVLKLKKVQHNFEVHRKLREMKIEDFDWLLNSQVRRVRWLHANSNRNLLVYDEKFVRLMIHKLKERIKELETQIKTPN